MYLIRQKFLVAGMSKSGAASASLLLKHGATVYIYDDVENEQVEKNMQELVTQGASRVRTSELDKMAEICDVLVLSPGIPIDHSLPILFKRRKKRIIGEMELGLLFLHNPTIAVTGTNGKTTIVTMIDDILKAEGTKSVACGNIGLPVCSVVDEIEPDAIAVLEVSSFQLETVYSLVPHIYVVSNITEDHLNRHYTMENYIFLKSKPMRMMRESEFAVLNYDDDNVRAFAEQAKSNVVYFSMDEVVDGGYIRDDTIYYFDEKIMSISELSLKGKQNIQNALAAICVAKIMGVSNASIQSSLKSLKGVKHRFEKIAEFDGVTYINDSKGTNIDATVTAIDQLDREAILLLGGQDKGYNYTTLFEKIKNSRVVHSILYGENRYKLLQAAIQNNENKITLCADFTLAVKIAQMTAKSGQAVLLSPASSSLDAFKNYEERGELFEKIILESMQQMEDRIKERVACATGDEDDEEYIEE